jgi:hypothetical protein
MYGNNEIFTVDTDYVTIFPCLELEQVTIYIVTYLINALPSNGSLNNLNNRETVFCGVRAATLATQRRGKYISTTIDAVFSVGSVLRLCKKSE